MYDELFQDIGLTGSEKKVYFALLELGDTTRSNVVKKAKIAGSKIYDILEKLREKGLATVYIKNKVKHFKPQNPKQILNFLETKEQELKRQKQSVQNVLPQLLAQFSATEETQEVELLIGYPSIKLFFQEQVEELNKGDVNYVIGGTKGSDEAHIIALFKNIHHQRETKGIQTKMLYNARQKIQVKKSFGKKEYPLTQTKFIEHSSAVSMNIHKNKVLLLIFGKELTGIKITSDAIAKSFLEYFQLLWKQSKP